MRLRLCGLGISLAVGACTTGGLSESPTGTGVSASAGSSSGSAHGSVGSGAGTGTGSGAGPTGGASATATAGSGSGGTTGVSSSAGSGASTTASGSGSGSGGLACNGGTCCGTEWAAGDQNCAAMALTGTPPASLYGASNDDGVNYGIYQILLGDAGSQLVANVTGSTSDGTPVDALSVVPGDGFVFARDDGPIDEYLGSQYAPLPLFNDNAIYTSVGLAEPDGILLVSTYDSETAVLSGESFPLSNDTWGANLWKAANSVGSGIETFQVAQAGNNTLVAASTAGAVVIVAPSGDVCFSQGCVNGATGLNFATGVAVDLSSGTLYVVGSDNSENPTPNGWVAALNSSGNCLWQRVGDPNLCSDLSGLGGLICTSCNYDSTLAGTPLSQAGFIGGTLYVSGLGTGAGGPIYSYRQSGGLTMVNNDHVYSALAVGR